MSLYSSSFNQAVLIVDDESMARTLLRLMLVREGYDVHEAEDGKEALLHMRQNRPQIIILDVMMPGMDGYDVCKEMSKDEHLNTIPVIMLSAKTDIESRKRGLAVGVVRYLTKPISPDQLIQHVSDVLGKTSNMVMA